MTKIEWTDETWNPTRGCSRVSEGCRNCYAERMAARNLPGNRSPTAPTASFAIYTEFGPRWTGRVELIESKLTEPLHWKKPRRVFVNSMSDLFHESLPTRDIVRCFAVMNLTPWITYQILTKRAKRVAAVIDAWMESNVKGCAWEMLGRIPKYNHQYLNFNSNTRPWPLTNVHLGFSAEDQLNYDNRREYMEYLAQKGWLTFCSYEPALGPIDFGFFEPGRPAFSLLRWVIIGGESGPQARPCRLNWIESTRDQCQAAGVPLFVKQVGSRPIGDIADLTWITQLDSKGGNWEVWPSDLRIREFPL